MLFKLHDLDAGTKELCAATAAKYTAVAADATADTVTLTLDDLAKIDVFSVQIMRSDVDVTADADVSVSGNELTIADGAATYAITAGDVIHIFAVGTRSE